MLFEQNAEVRRDKFISEKIFKNENIIEVEMG